MESMKMRMSQKEKESMNHQTKRKREGCNKQQLSKFKVTRLRKRFFEFPPFGKADAKSTPS